MENLTFRRVIIFCVKKNLGVTAIAGSSLQIVQSIEPKSQIRDRTFREKSRSLKTRSTNGKFDFSEGHNILREKKIRRNR